jgi:hypothetical protein
MDQGLELSTNLTTSSVCDNADFCSPQSKENRNSPTGQVTLSIKMNNPTTCVVCDNGVPTSEESPEVSYRAAGLHFDLCLQVQDNCVSRSQQQ